MLTTDITRSDTAYGDHPGSSWETARLRLTPTEQRILTRLLLRPGEWVSRSTMEAELWPRRPYRSGNLLDVHLGRLRAKIAAQVGRDVISTSRGTGWAIAAERREVVTFLAA